MKIKSSILKELNNQGFGLVVSNHKIGNKIYNVYSNGLFVIRVSVEYFTNTVWYNVLEYFTVNSEGLKADYTFSSLKVKETVNNMQLLNYLMNNLNMNNKVLCVSSVKSFIEGNSYYYVEIPSLKRTFYVMNEKGIFNKVLKENFKVA